VYGIVLQHLRVRASLQNLVEVNALFHHFLVRVQGNA